MKTLLIGFLSATAMVTAASAQAVNCYDLGHAISCDDGTYITRKPSGPDFGLLNGSNIPNATNQMLEAFRQGQEDQRRMNGR